MTILHAVLVGWLLAAPDTSAEPRRVWVSAERCTPRIQLQALGSVSSAPRDWRILHAHFKKFGQCDAGAVAEGYSHGVVTLLAHRWGDLGQLSSEGQADPTFLQFVLEHIDATTAEEDLRQVQANVESACPARHRELCRRVGAQAKAALEQHTASQR